MRTHFITWPWLIVKINRHRKFSIFLFYFSFEREVKEKLLLAHYSCGSHTTDVLLNSLDFSFFFFFLRKRVKNTRGQSASKNLKKKNERERERIFFDCCGRPSCRSSALFASILILLLGSGFVPCTDDPSRLYMCE